MIVTDLQDPYDPVLQPQHLDQAVAQKPDLIALLATNARSVVPGLRRAQAAGIPMINLVGPTVPESEPTSRRRSKITIGNWVSAPRPTLSRA